MENNGLKQEVVDKIKNDPILYGKVAGALNLKPISLFNVLATNHQKLTQASVLMVLREHLKCNDNALLSLLQEVE